MRPIRSSRRTLLLSLILAISFVFILFRHQTLEERQTFKWLEAPFFYATSWSSHLISKISEKANSVFHRYFFLVGLEEESENLRERLQSLESQQILQEGVEGENKRLRELLRIKERMGKEWIGARVVAHPLSAPFQMLIIDVGENDGVHRRSPVVSKDGLVGMVQRAFSTYSEVLLVTDPTSAVDVRIEKSNARGLVIGKVSQMKLDRDLYIGAFEYLNQATSIEHGAMVITSGLDGIYPPDIPVGFVHSSQKKQYDIFQEGEVIPSVDFFKLHEVLVQVGGLTVKPSPETRRSGDQP